MKSVRDLPITHRRRFEAAWWALHGPDCYQETDGEKVWFKRSTMWGKNGYWQPCVHFDWLDYQRGFLSFGKNCQRIEKALKKARLPIGRT